MLSYLAPLAHSYSPLHFARRKHWIAYCSPNIPWHFRLLSLCAGVPFACNKCLLLLCLSEQNICDLHNPNWRSLLSEISCWQLWGHSCFTSDILLHFLFNLYMLIFAFIILYQIFMKFLNWEMRLIPTISCIFIDFKWI